MAGNEVREGGFRIGLVVEHEADALANGQVGAQLTLQLNKANGKVPVDSTASIRPPSVLGLKYVDLHNGTSSQYVRRRGDDADRADSVPVQFEDIFKMFNAPTRDAIQQNLVGFGDTLAGAGLGAQRHDREPAGAVSVPAPGRAVPVRAEHRADAVRRHLDGFMGTVAPVAQTNAQLFTDMATTFAAIARNPPDLEGDDRRVAVDRAGLDSVAERPAAVPGRPDDARTEHGAGDAVARSALPILNPAIEAGHPGARRGRRL